MANEAGMGEDGSAPEHLIVGQVVAPFGVRGEMKVNIFTEFPDHLRKLGQIVLAPFDHIERRLVPAGSLNPATIRPEQGTVTRPHQTLRPPKEPTTFGVESTYIHGDQLRLKLEGIDAPEDVERLRGYWVLVPLDQAKRLPRGSYYLYQIVGLEVHTTKGQVIGKVEEVLPTAANDVYVVKGSGVQDPTGELLVPAIKPVVKKIELKRSRIVIAPPEEWA